MKRILVYFWCCYCCCCCSVKMILLQDAPHLMISEIQVEWDFLSLPTTSASEAASASLPVLQLWHQQAAKCTFRTIYTYIYMWLYKASENTSWPNLCSSLWCVNLSLTRCLRCNFSSLYVCMLSLKCCKTHKCCFQFWNYRTKYNI